MDNLNDNWNNPGKVASTPERTKSKCPFYCATFSLLTRDYVWQAAASTAGFGIGPDGLESIVSEGGCLEIFGGIEGVARKLSVTLENGACTFERPSIAERQSHYGSNRHDGKPRRSFWIFLWNAFKERISLFLLVFGLVSIGVGVAIEGSLQGVGEGLGVMFFSLFSVMTTAKTDHHLHFLFKEKQKKNKSNVRVIRDGVMRLISSDDVVVGDVMELRTGEQIPADGLFISGRSLVVDESSISGESEPVNVDKERPLLLSGTTVEDGSCKMLVIAVGVRTQWGRLLACIAHKDDNKPLSLQLNGIASFFGGIGLTLSLLVLIMAMIVSLLDKEALHGVSPVLKYVAVALHILFAAVPAGLPLAVALNLGLRPKKLMSGRALVRQTSVCENTSAVSCICVDRETLTTNQMLVNRTWICGRILVTNDHGDLLVPEIPQEAFNILLQSIQKTSTANMIEGQDGEKDFIGSSVESALLKYGLILGANSDPQSWEATRVRVVPFSSVRKKMSVLVSLRVGRTRALCKGAPDIILDLCERVLDCNGESVQFSSEERDTVKAAIHTFSAEGLRTLCYAYQDMAESLTEYRIPEHGYTLVAVVGIKSPLRPGVKDAVLGLLTAGIAVRMFTADNIDSAKAVARECGILTEDFRAIEGPDFRRKSPEELKNLIPKIQVMARSSSEDKQMLVTSLKNMSGEVVAVIGNRANDAPALRESDVGIVMGTAGTEVAKEEGCVLLLDENFSAIENVVKSARTAYSNVQKFVQIQWTINILALILNSVSACISGSAVLKPTQLLWVSMIMVILDALAPVSVTVNERVRTGPPEGRGMNLVTTSMLWNMIWQSIDHLAKYAILKFNGESLPRVDGSDVDSAVNT
ncbi:hypothetical protein RJ639_018618 [Escallonia herrerae]|uniref:Calcium-transporting ATPase n=1 Tax=Escallonia herrerae TaxID=1293975 RepID=A0AA88VAC7_9ASTE|nr:hypothetical protein RJ639_018618 [Escallonia herrerae]